MKYELIISEIAETEISDAYIWYNFQKVNLGEVFRTELINAISNISKNPYAFQNRYKNIRIAYLKKFPYGIHFNVKENIITVISVFHSSRNPKIWENR